MFKIIEYITFREGTLNIYAKNYQSCRSMSYNIFFFWAEFYIYKAGRG